MKELLDQITDLKLSLTKNRTEHLGRDVWNDFVVPRFYNKNNLISNMPTRLEGGRGSGKTMILRYLSYHSQFSQSRKKIPISALQRIGLYWKADTQFLRMMQKRSIAEEEWSRLFQHYFTVRTAADLVESIFYISKSDLVGVSKDLISKIEIKGLGDFGLSSVTLKEIKFELDSLLRKTEMIAHNISSMNELVTLPSTFLSYIISELKSNIILLKDSVFCVYIDEYENLLPYQQRCINTAIKHSEPPLIFNIAIKLNGMSESLTLSDERLENRADYQVVNLERELGDKEFDIYVSEIFIKKILEASPVLANKIDFEFEILTDPLRIDERSGDEYFQKVKNIIGNILPVRTHEDLAREVFETPRYLKKLRDEINRAIELSEEKGFSVDDFIDEKHMKASVVCSSLLFRKKLSLSVIKGEFDNLKNSVDSKFSQPTAWEHNNFIGSYLRIITSYKANSTFYSGFDVYASLSGGNVRHFLELCRTAFGMVDEREFLQNLSIDNKTQDLAAKITSEELYREIATFTPHGIQLQKLTSGLGGLFQECQKRESQSEPEVIHFGLKGDRSDFNDEDLIILAEAEKWGVLKSVASTKVKSSSAMNDFDYLLNPVYSPFFNITYRKNRKIDLDIEDFRGLYISGIGYLSTLRKKIGINIEKDDDGVFQGQLI